jgi:hypothetical protein
MAVFPALGVDSVSVRASNLLVLVVLVGCNRGQRSSDKLEAGALSSDPTPLVVNPVVQVSSDASLEPDDVEAGDAATVIGKLYSVGCVAKKASREWERCRQETIGYERLRDCMRGAVAQASGALGRLTGAPISTGKCGGAIERSIRRNIEGTAVYLGDIDRWLTFNQSSLQVSMASKSLAGACENSRCPDAPNVEDAPYAPLDRRQVQDAECTKPLFVCGSPDTPGSSCSPDEIAARLGVACDAKANLAPSKPDSRLYVRSTRKLITH